MALNASNTGNLKQLALKELMMTSAVSLALTWMV